MEGYSCKVFFLAVWCGWGASPTYVLMRMRLEIDGIDGINDNIVRFRPRLADMEWARGTVVIPPGLIEISWSRNANISGSFAGQVLLESSIE